MKESKGSPALLRGDRGGHRRCAVHRRPALLAAPQLVEQPHRPPGIARPIPQILVDAADALRDRQYAPMLAANRAGARNAVRSSPGTARRSPTSSWSNSSITPAPIAKRATRTSTSCCARTKGLRVVYRELPILGPEQRRPRRGCRSRRRRRAGSTSSTTPSRRPAGRRRRPMPLLLRPPELPADAAERRGDRSRAQAKLPARRPTRRDRDPRCSWLATGC